MSRPEDEPKRAVIVRTTLDGQTQVVGVAEGAQAEAVIAKARETGLDVRQDRHEVEQLTRGSEKERDSNVPPEIYELMSTIIGFAEELNEQWVALPPQE